MPEQLAFTTEIEIPSEDKTTPQVEVTFRDALDFATALLRVRQPLEALPDESDDASIAWKADSLCAQTDPEIFFPEKGGSVRDPKIICAACDVAAQCLAYALMNDERFGFWGGKSERDRRRLRRQLELELLEKQDAASNVLAPANL